MHPHAALALFIALAAYAAVSELDYRDAVAAHRVTLRLAGQP